MLSALIATTALLLPAARHRCAPVRLQAESDVTTTVATAAASSAGPLVEDLASISAGVRVEGSTLKTWPIEGVTTKRVQLQISSDGRPVDANIELWTTPSYIPAKFRVYTEDGRLRPVDAVIETPIHPKTIAVFNKAEGEFPFNANIADTGLDKAYASVSKLGAPEHVQGGKISSWTFGAEVESVQVLIASQDVGERNMKAKIELTQGPNQVKQVIELYVSAGYKNPFYCVIQTPGTGNAIRVINQNTVEFPFDAYVLPYKTGSGSDSVPIMGGF